MEAILESLDKTSLGRLKKFNVARIFINLALALFFVFNAAALAVFVVFLVLFVVNVVGGNLNGLYLALFSAAILLALFNNLWFLQQIIRLRKYWRTKFKAFAVPCVFSHTFQDAQFDPQSGISRKAVDSSGIVGAGNSFSSEDLISGKYKGVGFVKSDVSIQITSSRNRSTISNAFVGQWMIFDFNKPINAYVRVAERSLISGGGILGALFKDSTVLKGSIGTAKARIEGGEKVQVEDIAFNKKFEIVTRNPHTAFYILTPQFIEAVKYLESQIAGQLILAFSDNRLHVAVNSYRNDFEAKLSISARLNLETFHHQVQTTTKFVDLLRLDNDYFKS